MNLLFLPVCKYLIAVNLKGQTLLDLSVLYFKVHLDWSFLFLLLRSPVAALPALLDILSGLETVSNVFQRVSPFFRVIFLASRCINLKYLGFGFFPQSTATGFRMLHRMLKSAAFTKLFHMMHVSSTASRSVFSFCFPLSMTLTGVSECLWAGQD